MDKGWGLTLESSDKVSVFGNKPAVPPGFSLSPRFNNNTNNKGLIMFPLNSSGRDHHHVVSGEFDFFSGNKKSDELNRPVKKETNSGGELLETGLQLVIAANKTGSDGSTVDDGVSSDNLDHRRAKIELGQLRTELEKMTAENQRLKGMLTQVGNNYAALQMQFVTLMQNSQDSESEKPQETVGIETKKQENEAELVPRQFLDLAPSVARQASDEQSNSESEERTQAGSPRDNVGLSGNKRVIDPNESPESENWAPNKSPKLNPPKPAGVVEQSSEANMRKARVSVRARSEAPMISDGCQWRKYGQKMAKGNPCPRAYYRCTMAVGCPVRKQVQRCADDQTILITTYEGNHSHPLPPAAMAMASTTSAAANMLLSGSMPSSDTLMHPNFLARTMLPCSSNMATISASAPFPTITLDLTQSPNPSPFQRPSPPFHLPAQPGFTGHVQIPPQFFGQPIYNQSRFSGLQISNHHPQGTEQLPAQLHGNSPAAFSETLSAATAAITKDPNFTAALAAAISSIIGGGQTTTTGNTAGQNGTNNIPGVNTTTVDKNN